MGRSPAARAQRASKRHHILAVKALDRRDLAHRERTGPHASVAPMLSNPPPPLLRTRTRVISRPLQPPPPVPSTRSFYSSHPGRNRWLRVRQGNNATGDQTSHGVFAATTIPTGTRLAPYVGRICPPHRRGTYILSVRNEENSPQGIDAADERHDLGYHASLSTHRRQRTPLAPNYGRYVNTLTPHQQSMGIQFNTFFQPDPVEGFI